MRGGFYCPICRHVTANVFAENANKGDARCQKCRSKGRHRMIWMYLKTRTDFFISPLKVLHIAPSRCWVNILSKLRNLKYTSADLFLPFVDNKMDITDMSFPDETFDVVLCLHVLEHVLDDRKAMKELYRVLKPNGWGIIQSPFELEREVTYEDTRLITEEQRLKAFGQEDHVRIYGVDYKDRLEQAGFKVNMDYYFKEVHPAIVKHFLFQTHPIFYCQKK